jgi:hypothetical protein
MTMQKYKKMRNATLQEKRVDKKLRTSLFLPAIQH